MTAPNFPGFKNNSADFQGKRDQRASPLNFIDVDLSIARSAALGNILNIDVGGNLFYVDQNPDIGGFATVFFGDGTVRGGTPIYVGSGFLSNADFVQLGFSNVAQPGKILRVVYGTDVNFKPQFGSVQNVVVGNTAPLNVNIASPTALQVYTTAGVPAYITNIPGQAVVVASSDLYSAPTTSFFLGLMPSTAVNAAPANSRVAFATMIATGSGFPASTDVSLEIRSTSGILIYARINKRSNADGTLELVLRIEKFLAQAGVQFLAGNFGGGVITAHCSYS
jgi:hypothetical protein